MSIYSRNIRILASQLAVQLLPVPTERMLFPGIGILSHTNPARSAGCTPRIKYQTLIPSGIRRVYNQTVVPGNAWPCRATIQPSLIEPESIFFSLAGKSTAPWQHSPRFSDPDVPANYETVVGGPYPIHLQVHLLPVAEVVQARYFILVDSLWNYSKQAFWLLGN